MLTCVYQTDEIRQLILSAGERSRMNDQRIFDRLSEYLWHRYGARVTFKDESLFMRILGKLLFFNPGFMTYYITTIGRTIYFPNSDSIQEGSSWDVLAHESMHVRDYDESPYQFMLGYLFPQVLVGFSLFAIGGIWNHWFLLFLVFLLALLPLPAPFRKTAERRGYLMSICCDVIRYNDQYVQTFAYKKWLADQFTGPGYYFMWPFRKQVEKDVNFDVAYAICLVKGEFYNPLYSPTIQLVLAAGSTSSGSVK